MTESIYTIVEYNTRPKRYVIFESTNNPIYPEKSITGSMNKYEMKIMLDIMGLDIGDIVEDGTLRDGKHKLFDTYCLCEKTVKKSVNI